jgi:hypothetical protein
MSFDEGLRKVRRPRGGPFLRAAIGRAIDLVNVYQVAWKSGRNTQPGEFDSSLENHRKSQ